MKFSLFSKNRRGRNKNLSMSPKNCRRLKLNPLHSPGRALSGQEHHSHAPAHSKKKWSITEASEAIQHPSAEHFML